jgi:hypothetical protein
MLVFSISSCEKILIEKDPKNTPTNNFDILWKTLDEKYSFFVFKNVDWTAIYAKYRPLVNDDMSPEALFEVIDDMLYELKDGHVNLTSPFNLTRNWSWRLNSPPNFNWDIVERNYLGQNYRVTGPLRNTVIDSVAYIYYGSFSSGIQGQHIDFLARDFKGLKGLIFDVRSNGGGNTQNIETITKRIAKTKVLGAYWQYKSGAAHNDFTAPIAKYVEAQESNPIFDMPIIVLTNRNCYSATNDFVQMMRVLPNVTILGDTTGGGGGFPFNGELPNGWVYRFSTTVTTAPDGFNIEAGIPPDILVQLDSSDIHQGIDTMIEAALDLLK